MVETSGKEVLGRWWFACLVWTRPCTLLSRGATVRSDDSEEIVKARCHYTRADVDGIIYDLYHDAHVQGVQAQLENKLFLKDATSDLPAVTNNEMRDEMPYGGTPTTEFQRMIRLKRLRSMASSCSSHLPSSIMTLPTQKHLSSVDAVFGNDDLVTEILLRVPAKAVLKLKLVSKKWLSIISPTSFAILHTRRNPHTSCNGLLLCPKWRWCSTERSKPTDYIFNPTTRQFALLPLPPNDGKHFTQIQLVFDPLESPRYRVVCIQFFNSQLKIYVYSSETKDWKLSVKLENFDLLSVNFTDGVSWNGAVHWMSPMGNGLSFLLDMECLQTIPRPPLPENWQDKNFRYFGESGGQLHFIGILAGNKNPDNLSMGIVSPDMSHDQSTDQSIVVCSMERGCSKWFAKNCLHMHAIVMTYPEITGDKDPTASPFSAEKWFDLLSFIERNDEEGALLVMRISGEIISYSLKNNMLKKILSFPLKHATCHAFNYTETLSSPRPRPPNFTLSEQWVLMAATIFVCGFLGYVVYDAVMATASEMLQRLLVISPLILIISVHWLSSGSQFNIPIPGSEPGAIHRAGGSPWGLAFVLLLLFFLISYQPSLLGLFF
ncbi:hypothetical protein POTOM_012902 [Populus tomentosa]|uniref:F-box domain-containing protein n=1 Tax=Populus tomentosa TaxID=118781 RepID=A0A8X8AFJ3_POPTO|nr:hypothetical protein POTOM_012902 [Populus tomentosa]